MKHNWIYFSGDCPFYEYRQCLKSGEVERYDTDYKKWEAVRGQAKRNFEYLLQLDIVKEKNDEER